MKIFKILKQEFQDFCCSSSIAGLHHVADKSRSCLYKLFWFVIIWIAFTLSGVMVWSSVKEWINNPTVILVETTDHPVDRIPFPTVTICRKDNNLNKWNFMEKLLNFVEYPCYEDDKSFNDCKQNREFTSFLDRFLAEGTKEIFIENLKWLASLSLDDFKIQYDMIKKGSGERRFLTLLRNIAAENLNKLTDNLEKLKQDMNSYPLPGRHKNVFENYFVPNILERNKNLSDNFTKEKYDVLMSIENGTNMYRKINEYLIAIEKTYQRPFPPLGSTLASSGRLINKYIHDNNGTLELFFKKLAYHLFHGSNITFHDLIIAGSFMSYDKDPYFLRTKHRCSDAAFTKLLNNPDTCHRNESNSCCNLYTNASIDEHFETFLDIMKHSLSSTFVNEKEREEFIQKYVIKLSQNLNLKISQASPDILSQFWFCDLASEMTLSNVSCKKISYVSTGNGLCHSYNNLPARSIFQDNENLKQWSFIFEEKDDTSLDYPTMKIPPRSLYIVVQSFETSWTSLADNFIVSFTNEFDPFDITRDSFEILPGYQHTFRVIPSQLSTTHQFNKLGVNDRECRLKGDHWNLKLFNNYSKSSCEFECTIMAASDTCKCLPWYIPRVIKNFKTCDLIGNTCFRSMFRSSKLNEDCNCMRDCQTTAFSIFESTRPLNWKNCDSFENFVSLVQQRYKLYFALENVKNDYEANLASYQDICGLLKDNFISIIKVEMGTKSVIRSVRDVKATFEAQLSAVGGTLGLFTGLSIISLVEILLCCLATLKKLTVGG